MLRRLRVTKRLLAPLIKAQVSGEPKKKRGTELVYVLPRPSLTDLAVLSTTTTVLGLPNPESEFDADGAALRRFEFLTQNVGWLLRRSLMRSYPSGLKRAHELASSGNVIRIIPVSVFWSRAPQHETSTLRILMSERWTATTRLRRLVELLVNRKMVQVVFGPSIDLLELVNSELGPERELRRSARLLRMVFKNQRLALLGPELSLKRRALSLVLSHPEVRLAIERDALAQGRRPAQSVRLARRLLTGIVSDFSPITLRLVYRLVEWSWKIAGTEFTVRGLGQTRTCAQHANLVYLPCHQSHLDYIVLSFLLYRHGLALPHIAAGQNLDLPILGRILRQCGAFFIRRSFRDDDLYRNLITQYVRQMLFRGHPLEFFLEGTRSRSGFLMPARLGMLHVTLSAAQKSPARPLALIPVRFSFERLLDGDSFARELGGATKRRESWGDLFRGFTQIRTGLGNIGMALGEPIVIEDAGKLPAQSLADLVLRKINANLLVTGTHLVALALLGSPRRRMERSLLESQISLYGDWLSTEGYTCLGTQANACIAASQRQGLVQFERLAGVELISATAKGDRQLPWHRNNALHSLALPALMALASALEPLEDTPAVQVSTLWHLLAEELHLDKLTKRLHARWYRRLRDRNLLDASGSAASGASEAGRSLRLLGRLLIPTLERHLLILDTARREQSNQPLPRETLEAESLRRAAHLTEVCLEPLDRDCARLAVEALLATSTLVEQPGILPGPKSKAVAKHLSLCLPGDFVNALSS